VLRPGQPLATTIYPTDEEPATFHAGASADGGQLVGVATVSVEAHPFDPRPGDWRLRGMATDPAVRGQGFGALALRTCLDHVRQQGGTRVWCNARAPARGFYEHEGFALESDAFELPDIGPHYVMSIRL
jgi:GNAT superfamily N-acetyltransferase